MRNGRTVVDSLNYLDGSTAVQFISHFAFRIPH